MEYQILIVEDDGKIYKMLQEELNSDYGLFRARAVDEAIDEYQYSKETGFPFDCFIIDLQIIASGLTESEMVKYEKREGYALLKKIWRKYTKDKEYIKKRTIICSRYVSDFAKEYSEKELEGLTLIMKKTGFEKEVKKAVKLIVSRNKE